jgi:DnaJ-class molecular chaperone
MSNNEKMKLPKKPPIAIMCPKCGGAGLIGFFRNRKCNECNGSGRIQGDWKDV